MLINLQVNFVTWCTYENVISLYKILYSLVLSSKHSEKVMYFE